MIHKMQINGLDFKVSFSGNGPIVFLVHGFGGAPSDWDNVVHNLHSDFCLVKLDLRPLYQGDDKLDFDNQARYMSDLFLKCVEAFGVEMKESFHVVATSYGAAVALEAVRVISERVKSLTLINPMPVDPIVKMKMNALKVLFFLNSIPGGVRFFVHSRWGFKMMLTLAKVFKVNVGRKEHSIFSMRKVVLVQKAVERFLWIVKSKNWGGELSKVVEVPTFLIYGQEDPLFSKKIYESIQSRWSIAKTKICPLGGHMLPKTHAHVITPELYDFIISKEESSKQFKLNVEEVG
ncbi:MAG: alpha/beta hydrolase [Bdellovibrionales bacterium]|nr:alpha/beta hydrolase [Bdellovibrionales bacterium]